MPKKSTPGEQIVSDLKPFLTKYGLTATVILHDEDAATSEETDPEDPPIPSYHELPKRKRSKRISKRKLKKL